jgi:hypothetical protein
LSFSGPLNIAKNYYAKTKKFNIGFKKAELNADFDFVEKVEKNVVRKKFSMKK